MSTLKEKKEYTGLEIAVIGMAGRFPGARNIAEYWDNLQNGRESITFFSNQELEQAGVDKELLANPAYVKAMAVLAGIDRFDADFFDYTPAEAQVLDPQVRLFHECAWEALEDAGYVPGAYDGLIGLFAGASENFYWKSLTILSGKAEELGQFEVQQLTNKDYLCARTAYKLDLKGPVFHVQTACSTSLTAVHLACQALISGETDIALAGGVTVVPVKTGYLYQEGMILSPDGHCRTFDSSAKGTLGGNGLGIVVLKRLEDARADGDHIYALVKGSALNNDGFDKIGFTAPSVEGQRQVIVEALANAQVKAETVGYVEAHGTGTSLGDPVEFEALKLAYHSGKRGFCGIGSVKTNFGHLDSAAGVAGFIKTVLILQRRLLPPSLNFEIPNSKLNLIDSPFYVNTDLAAYEEGPYPRRAAVSSLGIGGTNVHVILEEWDEAGNESYPAAEQSHSYWEEISEQSKTDDYRLLVLSAKTRSALDKMTENLVCFLRENLLEAAQSADLEEEENGNSIFSPVKLADAAYTLQVGRKAFKYRRICVCKNAAEAVAALTQPDPALADEAGESFDHGEEIAHLIEEAGQDKTDKYRVLNEIGRLWLSGQRIDWHALYRDEKRKRISLPTYPFEPGRFWIEGDPYKLGAVAFSRQQTIAKETDMSRWFYIPSWERSHSLTRGIAQPLEPGLPDKSCWLLFVDEYGLADQAAERLAELGQDVVKVTIGSRFFKVNEQIGAYSSLYEYAIDPRNSSDYEKLIAELATRGKVPGKILHLWSLCSQVENHPAGCSEKCSESASGLSRETFDALQYRGFYSLIFLAKAINEKAFTSEIQAGVVTARLHDVTGGDPLYPALAPILGAARVIPQECPYMIYRCIDVVIPQARSPQAKLLVESLLAEFYSPVIDPVIAYRNNYRWLQTYKPLPLASPKTPIPRLKEKGVYLVIGGTGKIGFALARFLAEQVQARLVLVGRTALPDPGRWEQWLQTHPPEDPVCKKILKVRQLEQLGSRVLVVSADVSQQSQVAAALAKAEENFGAINGIIHTAGDTSASITTSLQRLDEENCRKQFQARVYGLLALEKAVGERQLDFCLIVSSLVSVLGGLGFTAYAGAVNFMDTFVHYHNQRCAVPWSVVNTAEWLFEKQGNPFTQAGAEMVELSMTEAEGSETFARVFSHCEEAQVITSTGDLQARIDKWVKLEAIRQAGLAPTDSDDLVSYHPRPESAGPYVPPATPLQRSMALTWQRFFGIAPIGIEDDFFQLGGDSLKVITLAAKIHKQFNTKISIEEFFARSTVKGLAEYLEKGDRQKDERYVAVESVEQKEYYPLSSAQKRLYLLQQFDPGSITYNIPLFLPLGNDAEKDRLIAALKELTARHESLRTYFMEVANEPVQRVRGAAAIDFEIEYYEIHEQSAAKSAALNQADEVQGIISRFIRPFELSRVPMLRAGLVKLSGSDYLLIADVHHIAADGTSLSILTEDLIRLYNGAHLTPLRLQYKDFSRWQNRLFRSPRLKPQESYWLELYRDAARIPRLDLPTDYLRPEVFNFAGSGYHFMLDREDVTRFKALGARHKATLYMNMLTALNTLFYKYTGQDDIILGTAVEGRPHVDLQPIIGMFVNTLVMRNSPQADKTYGSFLAEVAAHSLKALENQDVQFEELVDSLGLERDLSRNPLFDICMVIQNFRQAEQDFLPGENPGSIGKSLTSAEVNIGYKKTTSKFDMSFFIFETGEDEISVYIEYYSAIFKEETIKRLAVHFGNVIKAAAQDHSIKLGDIEILSQEEKKQVLYEFNDTFRQYPHDKTIQQLFLEQVEKNPDRVALSGSEQEAGSPVLHRALTYRRLYGESQKLATGLQAKGVEPDTIVGLMIERSFEMIIGLLGILHAGGAYLPIEMAYPAERVSYMLAESGAKLLVTANNKEGEKLRRWQGEIYYIENLFCSSYPLTFLPSYLQNSSDLAYIIYTSGTTGRPKGVMIDHRSVLRLVKNPDFIDFREGQRLLMTGALGFDISTLEIWGPLLNGLSLYIVAKETTLDVEKLRTAVINNDISILHLIPQLFNHFFDRCPDSFARLEYFLVGGDLVRPEPVFRLRDMYPGLKIVHAYGPTENTTFSTTFAVEKSYDEKLPIGKPIGNSSVYILARDGSLQPIGIPGELCTGGDGLARGYLNNPELTAERFEFDNRSYKSYRTYKSYSFEKIYRTGDLARWLPDGNIEFLGRMDHQVKIRGIRIELGEIENRLREYGDIKEAVVLDVDAAGGEKYLCAYLVAQRISPSEIKEYLSRSLPDYMIPQYFVPIDKIPLSANGKVDRKSLPAPEIAGNKEYTAPRSELEKRLASIWSEVLKIDKEHIGIDSDFFEIGGHSLRATMLRAAIHNEMQVEIPLPEIFKNKTIRALTGYIEQARKTRFTRIEHVEKKEYYPLSSAQKRLYFIQQMDAAVTAYNLPIVVPLARDIGKDRIESLLRKLIARHESLRTSFIMVNDEPVQRIHNPQDIDFEIEYYESSRPHTASQLIRPFDLAKAPLLRSGLIELPDHNHLWLVDMHHIVSDGTSSMNLTRDFVALFKGEELAPLRIQYKDFSQWQNDLFSSQAIKTQEDYWLSIYQDAGAIPRLQLPVDYRRPEVFTFTGDKVGFTLAREQAGQFRAIGMKYGATLFMNFLAALGTLLFKYTGETDIVVGCGIAGRTHVDIDPIIGMFVNTLAVRNFPHGEKTYKSFLEEAAAHCIKAFENQDMQLEMLVDKLDIERDTSRNPIFDICLVVQNFEPADTLVQLAAQDEKLFSKAARYKNTTAKFDLNFLIREAGEDIHIDIEYYTAIFKEETISRLISHLENVVKAVNRDPAIVLKDIEIMSAEEKKQVLYDFNDTYREYPAEKNIQQLFAEQAARFPGNIALISPGRKEITYRELDSQSDRLADSLTRQGLKHGDIAAVIAERTAETVIVIYAVLKAGGAYLPIDPLYPEERKSYILGDSNAKFMLTPKDLYREICSGETQTPGRRPAPGTANPAYIIYTSGSTGQPKGVVVEHRSAVNILFALQEAYPLTAHDTYLLKTSLLFDVSVTELFGWFFAGARLAILEPGGEKDPQAITVAIAEFAVTHINFVPSMFNLFVDALDSQNIGKIAGLKYLFLAGEAIMPEAIHKFRKLNKTVILENIYGPTEGTVYSSSYSLSHWQDEGSIPIGKPMPNIRLYILDKYYRFAPKGVPGELCTGGDGLARGYLNNPELTAEKFVISHKPIVISHSKFSPNDQCPMTNDLFYKTGDLARWLPDGNIEFLGRIDFQVKIRGMRIELGEIENRLLEHGDIKETVVLDVDTAAGDKYLCAYLVGENISSREIKEYLSRSLPDYMIPQYFVQLDKVPLNANGKVDRKALPAPEISWTEAFTAPRNEIEKKLAAVWADTLNIDIEKIGIDSNFFKLGGHSLKAAVMTAKIYKELGTKIPLAELFKTSTIRGLSGLIGKLSGEIFNRVEPVEKKEYYELSFNQKRLWIIQQRNRDDNSYNMPSRIIIDHKVDETVIREATAAIMNLHESLRIGFREVAGQAVQYVIEKYEIPFSAVDLSGLPAAQQEITLQKTLNEFELKPFHLDDPPLFKALLVKLADERWVFSFNMHHIITDGWSMGILERDFRRIYEAYRKGGVRVGEGNPITYKDFAYWRGRQLADAEKKKISHGFWLDFLNRDLPLLELPADRSGSGKEKQGATFRFVIPGAVKEALKNQGSEYNITLFSFMYSIYIIFLARLSGQEVVVTSIVNAGRDHAALLDIVGFFVNAVPFRKEVDFEEVFIDFAGKVQAEVFDFFKHQNYPLELVLDEVGLSYPDIAVSFNMVNVRSSESLALENMESYHTTGTQNVKFEIELYVSEYSNGVEIEATYNRALFKANDVAFMMAKYGKLIEFFALNPGKRLKDYKEKQKKKVFIK